VAILSSPDLLHLSQHHSVLAVSSDEATNCVLNSSFEEFSERRWSRQQHEHVRYHLLCDRSENGFLGVEVGVEGSVRDARLLHDVGDTRLHESVALKGASRGT
jgi:hypothetical protein